jgi:hypothetical protein
MLLVIFTRRQRGPNMFGNICAGSEPMQIPIECLLRASCAAFYSVIGAGADVGL